MSSQTRYSATLPANPFAFHQEGLADVVKNDVLKHIFSLATDALTLDVSSKINLPELYGGSICNLDLFDSNINDKFTELAERLN